MWRTEHPLEQDKENGLAILATQLLKLLSDKKANYSGIRSTSILLGYATTTGACTD